jgi:hypothetical protein
VDLFAHAVAQSGIHDLVALDAALAGECRAHDDGGEMLAVAFDFQV